MNSLFENSVTEYYISIKQTFSRLYNYMDVNGNILGKRDVFLCIPSQVGNSTLKPLPSLLFSVQSYYDLTVALSHARLILDQAELIPSSVQDSSLTEIQQTYYIQFLNSLDNSRISYECAEETHRNISHEFWYHMFNRVNYPYTTSSYV